MANISKSILPPDIMTTTFLFFKSILFVNAAVAATAPPGSIIIFKCSAKNLIELLTSSSLEHVSFATPETTTLYLAFDFLVSFTAAPTSPAATLSL